MFHRQFRQIPTNHSGRCKAVFAAVRSLVRKAWLFRKDDFIRTLMLIAPIAIVGKAGMFGIPRTRGDDSGK